MLDKLRVLDLSDAKAVYGGKLLADLGADVIKVEPLEGNVLRREEPFITGEAGRESSLTFAYFHTNQRAVTLDLSRRQGRELLHTLARTADVLIETYPPGGQEAYGVDYASLAELNARLIVVSVSPFGQTGPYSHYQADELVVLAASSALAASGAPEREPLLDPARLALVSAGVHAAMGALFALWERELSGVGQHVDVSMQEAALACLQEWAIPNQFTGSTITSDRREQGGLWPFCEASDGLVRFVINFDNHWDALREWAGNPELLMQPEWDDSRYRLANVDAIRFVMNEFTRNYNQQDLYAEGQKRGVPITPVYRPKQFLEDTQTRATGLITELPWPGHGALPWLAPVFFVGDARPMLRRPPPGLGQHNEELFGGELGLSVEELDALRRTSVI